MAKTVTTGPRGKRAVWLSMHVRGRLRVRLVYVGNAADLPTASAVDTVMFD